MCHFQRDGDGWWDVHVGHPESERRFRDAVASEFRRGSSACNEQRQNLGGGGKRVQGLNQERHVLARPQPDGIVWLLVGNGGIGKPLT